MPWQQSLPKDTSNDREKGNFAREVWTRVKFDTFPFAPAAIPSLFSATYTISTTAGDVVTDAVRFLRIGMGITVDWPSKPPAGLVMSGYCTGNDELKVQIQNYTGGPLTPPAGNYTFYGVVL